MKSEGFDTLRPIRDDAVAEIVRRVKERLDHQMTAQDEKVVALVAEVATYAANEAFAMGLRVGLEREAQS